MLALLLVALSLGPSNFAAAVGIGVSGVDGRTRLRVAVIFGLFEAGMPIVGLLLGRSLANTLGHAVNWIGATAPSAQLLALQKAAQRAWGAGPRPAYRI